MKNLSLQFFQKVLLFGLLFFSCFITFAQTLDDPIVTTQTQTVGFGQEIELVASCQDGVDLKWYEEVVSGSPMTVLTFNIEVTTTYIALCQSSCSCEVSNPVEIVITVDRPFNVTRSQSVCTGSSLELKASCPRGVVTWYNTTTDDPLGTATTISPSAQTTYLVSCKYDAETYESPLNEVVIYVPNNEQLVAPEPPEDPLAACLGGSVTLTASCETGTPIFYMSDSITEIDALVTNSPPTATYLARCENTDNCPSDFTPIEVTASEPLTPTGMSPSSTCPGENITLTASCTGNFSPQWFLENGTTEVFDVTDITPGVTTTYKVRCKGNSPLTDCYSALESFTVTVNNTDIVSQPTSVLACLGNTASFTVEVDDEDNTSFEWQKRQPNGEYVGIPDTDDKTFTIDSTVLANRGYYRCKITNGFCVSYTEEVFLTFAETITEKGKLVPPQVTTLDGFGNALALSDNLAVVGAWGKTNYKGAAYIFKNTDGKWSQVSQLTPSDLVVGDRFGSAMAISVTGDTIFVSAAGQTSSEGAVYMFRKLPNNTWTQVTKLKLPVTFGGPESGSYFGASIAVSNNFMAIGADGSEAVYTYLRDNSTGVWTPIEKLADGSISAQFGYAVGISENTLVVGSPSEGPSGAIFIYKKDELGFSSLNTIQTPDDLEFGVEFGQAVAISGSNIIASSYDYSDDKGQAFIYERDVSGNWSFKTELVSEDLTDDASFGYTVGIHDNMAIVGAYTNDFLTGTAIVFEKNTDGDWVQKKQILPENIQIGDQFGTAVGITKNAILVTSSFDITSSVTLNFLKGGAYFYGFYTPPPATVGAVKQAAGVCSGLKATFNLTGLLTTDSYTITYKIDVGGTLKTVVVTPDADGKASFTETLLWENNTKSIFITKVKNDVTGCEKVLNISSEITVKAATVITANPTRETVCVGETVVFMAEATGAGILNFQWQRQAPASSGFNSPLGNEFSDVSVLTLANRTLADNGAKYRVKVTGECGVATSTEALLTVLAKASVIMTAGPAVCPGSTGKVNFVGTPYAHVYYQNNGYTTSILLDGEGHATVTTNPLTAETTFNLVSIDVEGKCSKSLSGSVVIGVLPSGSIIVPPVVLTSPGDNVATSIVQTQTAQSLIVSNKISSGGKATHTGNKYIILGEGFESESGSVYVAAITPACP